MPYCPHEEGDVEMSYVGVVSETEQHKDLLYECPKCGYLAKFRHHKELVQLGQNHRN